MDSRKAHLGQRLHLRQPYQHLVNDRLNGETYSSRLGSWERHDVACYSLKYFEWLSRYLRERDTEVGQKAKGRYGKKGDVDYRRFRIAFPASGQADTRAISKAGGTTLGTFQPSPDHSQQFIVVDYAWLHPGHIAHQMSDRTRIRTRPHTPRRLLLPHLLRLDPTRHHHSPFLQSALPPLPPSHSGHPPPYLLHEYLHFHFHSH